jgi:hypothetical protein
MLLMSTSYWLLSIHRLVGPLMSDCIAMLPLKPFKSGIGNGAGNGTFCGAALFVV